MLLKAGKYNDKLFHKAALKHGRPRFPLKRDKLMKNTIVNSMPLLGIGLLLLEIYGLYMLIEGGTCHCNSRFLSRLSDDNIVEFSSECGLAETSDSELRKFTDCMVYFDA